MNKALSGLLVYRTIMPLAKRSPSNFFEHSLALSSDTPVAGGGLFTNLSRFYGSRVKSPFGESSCRIDERRCICCYRLALIIGNRKIYVAQSP